MNFPGSIRHVQDFCQREIEPGESAIQVIDRLCFTKDGLLHDEFKSLYHSLFDEASDHMEIIRELAKKGSGLTRGESHHSNRGVSSIFILWLTSLPSLRPGDTIAIVCPAGYMPRERAQICIDTLRQWGYRVKPGRTLGGDSDNYFSGNDEARLADLQTATR